MLGGILKLTLFLNILFLFMVLLWQATTADALPILANNDHLANSNDDVSSLSANNNNNQKGALVVKRSLHSTVNQQPLIDSSPLHFRLRRRRLRKKLSPTKLKNSPNVFQSTGTGKNYLRGSKRIESILDDRLKRFRMLDPDEFQEMLNSWSYQVPDQPIKELESMDTIGGMQLENYWLRK